MKNFLQVILIIFITILLIAMAALAYIFIKNPLGLGDAIKSTIAQHDSVSEKNTSATYDHPLLNAEQETKLTNIGVDVKKIPTEITPEQQQCALKKLGEQRIKEIINGSEPSPLEILKVTPCL